MTQERGESEIMQDAHTIEEIFNGSPTQSLFGVYNSTGGDSLTASYVANNMNENLSTALSFGQEVTVDQALRDSFIKIDSDTGLKDEMDLQRRGATSAAVFVDGDELYIANAGNTLVVLDRGGHTVQLTTNHTLSDSDERERIERDGAIMEYEGYSYVYDDERKSGVIPTRAIGFHNYPGVIAKPSVLQTKIKLSDRLIIANETEFWRYFENQQDAFDAIRDLTDAKTASDRLSAMARKRGSNRNLSVMVIDAKSPKIEKEDTDITSAAGAPTSAVSGVPAATASGVAEEDGATGTESASAEEIQTQRPHELTSSPTLLQDIEIGLNQSRDRGERETEFAVAPGVLQEFLKANADVFREGTTIEDDFTLRSERDSLHMAGTLNVIVRSRPIKVILNEAIFTVDEQGQVVLVANDKTPKYELQGKIPRGLGGFAKRKALQIFKDTDEKLREVLYRQIEKQAPGWKVSGFGIDQENIKVIFGRAKP